MKYSFKKLLKNYFLKHYIAYIISIVLIIMVQLTALIEPAILKYVIDSIIPEKNIKALFIIGFVAIFVKLGSTVLNYIQSKISVIVGAKIFENFVVDFYNHIQHLDLAFFADTKMGEFMQRLSQDTYHLYRLIFNGLLMTVSNVLFIVILYIYAFYLNPILALLTLITLPFYIFAQKYTGKLTRRASEKMVTDWGAVSSFQHEKLGGIRLIKELTAEDLMKQKYRELNQNAGKSFSDLELASDLGRMILSFTVFLGPITIIICGGYLHIKNMMSLGSLLAFFYFSGKLFSPISQIINQLLAFQRAEIGLKRIYEYYERKPKIQNPIHPQTLKEGPLSLSFESVNFSYEKERKVLRDFSLKIKAGSITGIVGTSGSGKSTLASLIFRFQDICSGKLMINNHDIKEIELSKLRSRISIVSQDTILFHDSILENLKLAKPSANIDEITSVCKIAEIYNFIISLADGFDTVIGEKGVKLSGGQRQRLSIARALLKNPDLIILDEATSHLDSEVEKEIKTSIEKILKNRTAIIIAHRLSTLTNCDNIAVMEEGKIIETGKHEELLSMKGKYNKLWQLQTV